jgi:hypothetical protein
MRFLIASIESVCVPFNDGWENKILCRITNSLEMIWNADEFLHFAEIFGFDFLKWWTELEPLLSEIVESSQ